MLPTASLVPYARNAKRHDDAQVAKLAGSIREYGFTNPVLIDADNGIIAGHGRILGAQKLGLAEVPCIRLSHLTETQRRAYVLADNRLAEIGGGWDADMLRIEVEELREAGVDLDGIGLDADSLAELLPERVKEGLTDADETPEPPTQPVSVAGDVWVMGNHRLMCGDSTSLTEVEQLMDNGKAVFCFTSPPYNLGKSVALRNGARKGTDSAYNDFKDNGEWPELMRGFLNNSITNSRVSCVNVQMLSGNKFDLLSLFGEYALNTIDIAIWVKTNPPPAMAEGVMNSAYEFMWFLSDEEKPNRRIKTSAFDRGTFSNVFSHSTASGHDASVHGAVFPLAIAEHYIQNCSSKGDIVLEFFGGTGTTLIACEKTGRQARLMELDPRYVDVIVIRWQTFTGKEAVNEATGLTFAATKAKMEGR